MTATTRSRYSASTVIERTFATLLLAAVVSSLAIVLAGPARADPSFDFANLSPSNGAHISYEDWQAGGRYVTFSIQPDSNYPCASEYYYLEVNGQRVGQFNSNCTVSVYLPATGSYSWRTILYVFQTATTATGTVTTLTVDPEIAQAPTPTQAIAPNLDISPPSIGLGKQTVPVHIQDLLLFRVHDNSGRAAVVLLVSANGKTVHHWTYRLQDFQAGANYYVNWTPSKVGAYEFCVEAVDASGNKSAARCAPLIVR